MKNILKKLMSNNESKMDKPKPQPKLAPWEVVRDIKKNYNKTQQLRILKLLNIELSPPNPNRR